MTLSPMRRMFLAVLFLCACAASSASAQSFVNWESPHVSPLDITPDGELLLAVNTADNRLEVFALDDSGSPVHLGSVPVGLDPVSVRARSNSEAWVVNHISDSVSVVDLPTMRVRATIGTGDEPTDVVFAGSGGAERAFVSVSQLNQIQVYDPATLALLSSIMVQGEDPRALATDGVNVYAAIFDSGNNTTILPQTVVSSSVNPYPSDINPPPNSGTNFVPPKNPANPAAPAVSLIVRKLNGNWVDDNPSAPGNWNAAVTWNLHDHDIAVINADSLAVSYISGLMNLNMHLAVKPGGQVTVVGTDAINHIRFEPNVKGVFLRVVGANFPAPGAGGGSPTIVDLNPHLDYTTGTIAQAQRDLSIGDPRGIAWNAAGDRAFITGMGSNNLIVADGNLARIANIEVGQGPTGVKLDSKRERIYVLNKFDATISVLSEMSLSPLETVSIHDPTPSVIKIGRPHLYDTHKTSGLGYASCASCHIDGRMDQLAWDLGDPTGEVEDNNNVCNLGIPGLGVCEDFHPMKGPMATQTLIGIIGTEPFHWRGDRVNLAAFNPAFVNLMGDDEMLTQQEMLQFTSFVGTLRYPPNPFRNMNNSLRTSVPTTNGFGNAANGLSLFNTGNLDLVNCVTCHALPSGTNGEMTSANLLQETQSVKIPQLRNMYEKTGFVKIGAGAQNSNRGFGFIHDGSIANLFEFFQFNGFNFANDQQRRDVEAFMLSFSTDTHAGAGTQTTVINGADIPPAQSSLILNMASLANGGSVGLVVKGIVNGEARGWRFDPPGTYQSDRAAESITHTNLVALAAPGSELTFTLVPAGSQTRIGIDRDSDGFFDRDELDACADPADGTSTPNNVCVADIAPAGAGDGQVNVSDLLLVINQWGASGVPGTVIGDAGPDCGDGLVNVADLLAVINAWGACP